MVIIGRYERMIKGYIELYMFEAAQSIADVSRKTMEWGTGKETKIQWMSLLMSATLSLWTFPTHVG
jgi:hypothetical protein